MAYGDAIASAAPSPLEGCDRRANADPRALTAPARARPGAPGPPGASRALPRGRPGADPSRADVPSVFLELLVAIRSERHELTRDERDALRRCEEQMQSRAVVAGYLTGAGTNALLKTLPAFKTQPVGRYIAAVSFGVTGAFYGARSAARACLERIVRLEDSRLGELAADAVRRSAPLDPMLAKAPNATGGDAAGGLGAGGDVAGGLGASGGGDGRKGGGAATSTRAAIIRAAAEAEASRRVRARERRPSPPVVDLFEEPRASASASASARTSARTSASTSASGDGFVGFDLSRDALAAAGMHGGDAWATVGHVSDTSGTGRGGGGGGGASGAREREGTRERRLKAAAERAKRRVDRADAILPFLGEESRPTPEMFDASELAARRERERAGRARPRATIRTEYGDVMDR